MPSIKKIGEDKYRIRVSKGTGSRRVWDFQIFDGTLTEAREEAREMQLLLGKGKLTSVRFEKCVALWIKSITPRLEPRTVDGYESSIRLYATPIIGKTKLGKITREDVQRLYLDCTKSGTTVRNFHAALNAFFSWCIKRDDLRINPCKNTERPKKKHTTMVVLDSFEARNLVDICQTHTNGIVFEFALETGMRPEEYLALRWSDVVGSDIIVQRAVQFERKGGGYYYKDIKTKYGRRRIPISEDLRRQLTRHRTEQLKHRLAMKGTWFNEDLVFPNTIGRPFALNNLTRRYFAPIIEAMWPPLELPPAEPGGEPVRHPNPDAKHITLYSLRHTCATLLLMNGTNPKIVSERLGHASVVITLDTYSHVLPHIQDEATAALDSILRFKKQA